MAQTTSVRSATIAASVTASPRIRHCKRDSDGRHRHHDSRQDRNQDRNQDSRHDRHHDRHQDCCLTAPMTRATPRGDALARRGHRRACRLRPDRLGGRARRPGWHAVRPAPTRFQLISQNCRGSPQPRQRRSRRIGRSLGDSGQGAPYRRHCIRRDQSLSVSESCACQTQRQRWQRSLRVQPLASRRLAISTP